MLQIFAMLKNILTEKIETHQKCQKQNKITTNI